MDQPKYREDAKDSIAGVKADFVNVLRNELSSGDAFLFTVEDSERFDEYAQYLTTRELQACFKAAHKVV
jgi:hypothetical protein